MGRWTSPKQVRNGAEPVIGILLDIVSFGLLSAGGLLCMVAGIGLHRLPDFYTRMHANGVGDTLAAPLILLGLLLQAGEALVAAKLILVLSLLFLTSPTSAHALARAAFAHGLRPVLDDGDQYQDSFRLGDLVAPAEEDAPSA